MFITDKLFLMFYLYQLSQSENYMVCLFIMILYEYAQ